jgi:DNA-binding winged helix-turn-helix (wHTH) protein/serine/threonine protein kinase
VTFLDPAGHASRAPGCIWRFADCELDQRARELRVRGTPVEIEAKPLDLLIQLLLHAGEVVTKDELLAGVWPGLSVADGSLATAVSKIRKLLGDSDQSVIVTVARVGYKLAVPVHLKSSARFDSPDLPLAPGQPVPGRDQWRLMRRLDRSRLSEVWLAEHPKTRELRVFKFAGNAEQLRSLKREVTVARLLREALGERPEFVRILEWNLETAPYFIESEYAGLTLAEWTEAQGGLNRVPLELRLALLGTVANAVAAAHAIDLVHKDLKPANILVSSTGPGTPAIKIADFGAASLLVPERLGELGITNLGFTHAGAAGKHELTGTMMYVAPEVLAGQAATAASDIYALGVLLYQLVAGDLRKPVAAGWESDVSDAMLRQDIADAACGDPARRLATAASLATRLATLGQRRAEYDERQRRLHDSKVDVDSARAARRRQWATFGALAVLATIAAVVLSTRSGTSSRSIRTVAVLPLENTRSDPDIAFLRTALADEVATVLSHSHGLQVRPLSAASRTDPADLRAESIVTGRYVRDGGQLHVTLEAIDVEGGRLAWRDSFQAPAESLIATRVQIALRVRAGLAPALGAPVTDTVVEPRNEEAFELYLRSVALPLVPAFNEQGLQMLERAVELDPGYPPAWLAVGRRYYTNSRYGAGGAAMMQRYDDAMKRALALDPNYVAAAAGLIVSRVERGDLVGAYGRATDLARRRPDSADAEFALSYVLRYAGLLEEAGEHCEAAFVLDRGMQTSGLRTCTMVFMLRGDYPRAMNYLHFDQGADFAKAMKIDMLARQGQIEAAVHLGSLKIPAWKSYDLLLACLARRPASEIAELVRSVADSDDPELNYFAAAHLASCGEVNRAVDLLKAAIAGNYCSYPAMESDPLLARVRASPEYEALRTSGAACQSRFVAQRNR